MPLLAVANDAETVETDKAACGVVAWWRGVVVWWRGGVVVWWYGGWWLVVGGQAGEPAMQINGAAALQAEMGRAQRMGLWLPVLHGDLQPHVQQHGRGPRRDRRPLQCQGTPHRL